MRTSSVEGQKYKNICPKEIELVFLKGYKKGDKKCLYEAGYVDALNGRTSSFSSVKCLKLSADQSHKEYEKGQNAGLKVFCSYKVGYSFGLRNASYQNICPRNLETDFMKGYTLGLQEYKAEQRQREFLDIERQKIAVERERTQQLLSIERQKMAIEAERLRGEQSAREDFLHLQRLKRYQICRFDFDCHRGGICRYHFRLNNYVCRYD